MGMVVGGVLVTGALVGLIPLVPFLAHHVSRLIGELPFLRHEIVRTAIARAEEHLGCSFDAENIFVIGDTVHDIQAGKAVGAATIAVATGKTSAEVLAGAGPDLIVKTLEDPRVEKFFSR